LGRFKNEKERIKNGIRCGQVNTAQRQMAGQAGRTGGAFKGLWKQMAVGLGVAGGVALAIRAVNNQFKDVIRKGREFEREWANVTTMLTISTRETEKMRDELKKMSPTLGDTTTLAKGMYQVLSASIKPSKAIKFLGEAAKSATAGVTDAKTAVDALTTVINAYGKEAEDVTDVSDIMFQTVKRGKLTYEELANSLGTAVPIAATIGIKFEDVAAAVATMTRQGVVASKATMQLRQVMAAVLGPGEEARELAKEIGLEFNATALKTKGLSGFMADLREKTGGNTEMMKVLVPNVRALLSVMILAGSGAEGFAKDIKLMAKASGSTEVAFQKQMKSMNFWIEATETSIDKLKIAFYEGFTKPFRASITTSEELDKSVKNLTDSIQTLGEVMGAASKLGMFKLVKQGNTALSIYKQLGFTFDLLVRTIKNKKIPTLKNLNDTYLEIIESGKDYSEILEHLEEWLILGAKSTDDINLAMGDFSKTLGQAKNKIDEIKAAQFKKELDDFYEGLKNLGEPAEEFTEEAGDAGSAWASVLDQLGMQIYGINIFFKDMTATAGEAADTIAEKFRVAIENLQAQLSNFFFVFQTIFGQIDAIAEQTYQNEMIRIDNEYQTREQALLDDYEARKAWIEANITDEGERDEALRELEEERNAALEELREETDEKVKEAQKARAAATKAIALAAAIMNTAQAITRTLASVPFPFNLPLAAAVAALGAIQVSRIAAQPLPMAEGGIVKKRTLVEAGEAGPELYLPLEKAADFLADYEKKRRRTSHPLEKGEQTVLQPINLNVDGKRMARVTAKYTAELSKDGHMKFHIAGLINN